MDSFGYARFCIASMLAQKQNSLAGTGNKAYMQAETRFVRVPGNCVCVGIFVAIYIIRNKKI